MHLLRVKVNYDQDIEERLKFSFSCLQREPLQFYGN